MGSPAVESSEDSDKQGETTTPAEVATETVAAAEKRHQPLPHSEKQQHHTDSRSARDVEEEEQNGTDQPERGRDRKIDKTKDMEDDEEHSIDDASQMESTLRFLVSNFGAGTIIGKGGSTIQELQQQSGARITLSRTHEYFPGTNMRIAMLAGPVSAILTALHLILSRIYEAQKGTREYQVGDRESMDTTLRMIVPNKICGAIIGKGGATIRSFVEDSGAHIKLSPVDPSAVVSDRLVVINGELQQQLRGVALLLTRMSSDPAYALYSNVPLHYNAAAYSRGSSSSAPFRDHHSFPPAVSLRSSSGRSYNIQSPPPQLPQRPLIQAGNVTTTVTIALPDEHAGAVVGKGGRTLVEIQQLSSATLRISDRGDFVEGTNNRKLSITGSLEAVSHAQQLVTQHVQQNMQNQNQQQQQQKHLNLQHHHHQQQQLLAESSYRGGKGSSSIRRSTSGYGGATAGGGNGDAVGGAGSSSLRRDRYSPYERRSEKKVGRETTSGTDDYYYTGRSSKRESSDGGGRVAKDRERDREHSGRDDRSYRSASKR